MGNRVFMGVVIVLWLSTMTWLVVEKVLPPLLVGDPPTYRAMFPSESQRNLPVCWHVFWNERPVGWASSKIEVSHTGSKTVHSQVVFEGLPIEEIAPAWLGSLVKHAGKIDMRAESRLQFDPLGELSGFQTSVRLAELEDVIKMTGRIEQSKLMLTVRSGNFQYNAENSLPPGALVGNELSPQAHLRGLRVGQKWTMPVTSPFRTPTGGAMDIVQAVVEQESVLVWGEEPVRVRLVVYRNQAGTASTAEDNIRGQLWVRLDGTVLRQEMTVLNSSISFVRMTPEEAENHSDDP